MSFLKMLDRPPREYTPVPFWFLNGDLSHEEIRRQLRDFCDHGVYGAVLHPRMGLREDIGYLSESFFGYMRTAIETAAELDMRIVLYDEGMYPSGSAGGLVVRDRPDLASRGIARVRELRDGDTLLYEKDGLIFTGKVWTLPLSGSVIPPRFLPAAATSMSARTRRKWRSCPSTDSSAAFPSGRRIISGFLPRIPGTALPNCG